MFAHPGQFCRPVCVFATLHGILTHLNSSLLFVFVTLHRIFAFLNAFPCCLCLQLCTEFFTFLNAFPCCLYLQLCTEFFTFLNAFPCCLYMELLRKFFGMLPFLYCLYVSVVGAVEYLLRYHIRYPIFSVFHLLTHCSVDCFGHKRRVLVFVC
jgi:hypothetical protein